jgi:hypothetical protein
VSMRSVKLVAGEPTPTESVYVTPKVISRRNSLEARADAYQRW